MAKTNVTEADIIKALFTWHRDRGELFFPHVKTGASWTYKEKILRILDGLAVKVSWSHPVFQGYEVKISRSDFLRDKKYTDYLPFCTGFSFACPDKMIAKDELPGNIGLVYYRADGSLRTARRPEQTLPSPETLNNMLRYLVYYRTGSNRQQIAAAARQVARERHLKSEAERDVKRLRESLYALQDKYYDLKHGKEA